MRIFVLLAMLLAFLLPAPGCTVADAKKQLATHQRIMVQISSYHQMVDTLIRQLAAGDVSEEEALATLQGQVEASPGNVELVQSWQAIQAGVQAGEPLLATLINISDLVGKISERYTVTLAELEARLANAEDGQDATLAVIASVVTLLTGLPIAAVVSSNRSKKAEVRGATAGIEHGTYYGAAKVANAIGGLKLADEGVAKAFANDTAPGVIGLRNAINADATVSEAVSDYKAGDVAPAKPSAESVVAHK